MLDLNLMILTDYALLFKTKIEDSDSEFVVADAYINLLKFAVAVIPLGFFLMFTSTSVLVSQTLSSRLFKVAIQNLNRLWNMKKK